MSKYQKRTYRDIVKNSHLKAFTVSVKETDLAVYASQPLEKITTDLILQHRGYLEAYINRYPEFLHAMIPWPVSGPAPDIVRKMAEAGRKAGIGPMAAVAGAIAEYVGKGLLEYTDEVIVENGGDIFLKCRQPTVIGIFAGRSPLSLRIGLRIPASIAMGVCTSSGVVGHSTSMGKADAVCVVSHTCPVADAAATAIGNKVRSSKDIRKAIDFGKVIPDIEGIVIISGEKMGAWGNLDMVSLKEKG
jgi:ApbE superfamily uncharacterized protein (UPF0280 family)